jgi:glycosyltransferase involved in cell wall biosynthesis
MRVLVVTSAPPWLPTHGGAVILRHHLRVLSPRHEITLLAAGGPPGGQTLRGPQEGLPTGVDAKWIGTRVPTAIDYLVRRARSEFSREPAHVHWVERPALIQTLQQAVEERRPDVVHLYGWGTAQLARLARAVPALHIAVDAWSIGVVDRRLPGWRRFTDAGQPAKIVAHERRHYPGCRAVGVFSPRDADYLRRLAPHARIEVIPVGVSSGGDPPPPTASPILGFHGAYSHIPNRDAAEVLARHILPLVRRRVPDARLLLIGPDPSRDIRMLAGEAVELTGEVPDVRRELSRVAVYVAPMVSGTGIKTKVLEAMTAGLPIVATSLALEGIGAGPGIDAIETPAEIAERAAALLTSEEERRGQGRAARKRVCADFTWERSARAVEELWEQLA